MLEVRWGLPVRRIIVYQGGERVVYSTGDKMRGSYLGPAYSDDDVMRMCRKYQAKAERYDFAILTEMAATLLADGKIIGWHQGRMEWGPRALGGRSILGDPRCPNMQKRLNLKIKIS